MDFRWADRHKGGTRYYAEQMFSLLAYLDSGATVGPIEWVIAAVIVIAILLVAIYALTRFVKWAANR